MARPELLAQRLSRSEVLAEVENDASALDPIFALIYARRGRVFKSLRWMKFAMAQAWYHPEPGYTDAKLAAVDRANLAASRVSPTAHGRRSTITVRAISLTFRDGKTVGKVESFALDGRPWQKGNLHERCGHGRASELGHLDIESLPPIPPEPCRDGVVGAAGAWPRGVIGALVAASRKVFDDTSNCSVVKCVDSVSISCAPDLDGKLGGEVLAVMACRVPLAVDCPGCAPPNVEYANVAANILFSPPTHARASWTTRGLVSCREASDLEGDPRSKVQNYLRLPDGEAAILTVDSASNSDDGRDDCALVRRGLRRGKWQDLLTGSDSPCEGDPSEPEEFDVY